MSTNPVCSRQVFTDPADGDYKCGDPGVVIVTASSVSYIQAGDVLCDTHRRLAESSGVSTRSLSMSTGPHPAACPHCGGTVLSQAQPDYIVRPVQLADDGSVIIGDPIDGADFPGPSLLYCYGCDSLYVQSAGIAEHHDSDLSVTYPEAPAPGHPDHKGWRVAWTPVPSGGEGLTIDVAGGESGEYIAAVTGEA